MVSRSTTVTSNGFKHFIQPAKLNSEPGSWTHCINILCCRMEITFGDKGRQNYPVWKETPRFEICNERRENRDSCLNPCGKNDLGLTPGWTENISLQSLQFESYRVCVNVMFFINFIRFCSCFSIHKMARSDCWTNPVCRSLSLTPVLHPSTSKLTKICTILVKNHLDGTESYLQAGPAGQINALSIHDRKD